MHRIICSVALVAMVATGCADDGAADSGGEGSVKVEITMRDNAFSPTTVTVPKGKRVTLTFTNAGSTVHEAIIGDTTVQDDHAADMADGSSMSGMGHGSDDRTVSVDPGQSVDLSTTFDAAGRLIIGCHEPGHYEAGMKATLEVA